MEKRKEKKGKSKKVQYRYHRLDDLPGEAKEGWHFLTGAGMADSDVVRSCWSTDIT